MAKTREVAQSLYNPEQNSLNLRESSGQLCREKVFDVSGGSTRLRGESIKEVLTEFDTFLVQCHPEQGYYLSFQQTHINASDR